MLSEATREYDYLTTIRCEFVARKS